MNLHEPKAQAEPPRPAAPWPRPKRPGFFTAMRAFNDNPLTAFSVKAYEASILDVGRFRSILLISDPAAVEQILVTDVARYRKSLQQRRQLQPALGNGLLTAEGEEWRGTRRVASPLFAPKAIGLLFGDMQDATAAMRQRWFDRPHPDEALDLSAEFQRLTYEIVSRTVFSGALDDDRARIHASMALYFDTLGRIDAANVFNLPTWLSTPAKRRARPAIAAFRSIIDRVVEARSAETDRTASDLLDRLMQGVDPATGKPIPVASVSDNVLTFLAAGHETTGNALAWVFYLLALFPHAEEAVLAELETVLGGTMPTRADLDRLVVARAVVNEALRLYPPAPFMGREPLQDETLVGRTVKAGTQLVISPWLMHRHRALWQDPDAFQFERFLPPRLGEIRRGAFLPFGLGPRICIGQGFAIQEILTVVATILPAFRLRLADARAVFPRARITLSSAGGMPMFVTRRG